MSETASVAGQKSQESGIQLVPGTQGTSGAHTPGPWVVDDKYASICIRPTREGGATTGWLLATIPRETPGLCMYEQRGGTSEGNARLIAAAPDLLAELVAANDIIRKLCEACIRHVPTSDPTFVLDVRAPERTAALAKAGR